MGVRTRAYAWYILGLLTAINFVNYVDRMVVTSMYGDLRAHFGLSDFELGMLGTGFFAVHAILTLPFGWAADHWDRVRVLAGGVIIWSLATLGSAYALGFLSLLAMRSMIGVGEAAYGPVANALLCDTFRPGEKARVVAIFNVGMFAGACIGMVAGQKLGFPTAFQVVAIPGLVLGVVAWRIDVPRRRVEGAAAASVPRPIELLWRGWSSINVRTLRWMLVSGILISFAAGGYIAWFVEFVLRYGQVPQKHAVLIYGGMAVSGGLCGVVAGGWVADRLQRRLRQGRVLTIGIGFLAATPFAFGAVLLDGGWPFYVACWLLMFFIPWYNGPIAAVVDDVVDNDKASLSQATFSFLLHLIGTAPASAVVGLVSKRTDLRTALLVPCIATGLAGLFALGACRHVDADMRARSARNQGTMAA